MIVVLIIFAIASFMIAARASNVSLDEKWKRHEEFMLTRGIQAVRTPQWEKQTKQTAPAFVMLGIFILLIAVFVGYMEKLIQQDRPLFGPQTTIKKNGMTLTMTSEDFQVCGPNPPDTCPPEIRRKYTWQNDPEASPQ